MKILGDCDCETPVILNTEFTKSLRRVHVEDEHGNLYCGWEKEGLVNRGGRLKDGPAAKANREKRAKKLAEMLAKQREKNLVVERIKQKRERNEDMTASDMNDLADLFLKRI